MIKIKRDSGYADRLRTYQILLDGHVIGEIKNGEEKEFHVSPGAHELAVKIDWCRTPPITFDQGGDSHHFECGSNLLGWRLAFAILYVLFWRSEYIWLRKV